MKSTAARMENQKPVDVGKQSEGRKTIFPAQRSWTFMKFAIFIVDSQGACHAMKKEVANPMAEKQFGRRTCHEMSWNLQLTWWQNSSGAAIFMKFHEFRESSWIFMKIHKNFMKFMKFHEIHENFMKFMKFHDIREISWNLRFCWLKASHRTRNEGNFMKFANAYGANSSRTMFFVIFHEICDAPHGNAHFDCKLDGNLEREIPWNFVKFTL